MVTFMPWPLYPMERDPGTHCIGSWVGPRAVLEMVVKRKFPSPCQELNPRTLTVQPVAQQYTDGAITSLIGDHKDIIMHKAIYLLAKE
jgi:hypothetical protein